jgi:hypothetical protein
MVSGTNVPSPRTSRSIGPRFTVSVHTVARSTLGAAGFSLESAYVTNGISTTAAAMYAIRRTFFCRLTSGRAISKAVTSPHLSDISQINFRCHIFSKSIKLCTLWAAASPRQAWFARSGETLVPLANKKVGSGAAKVPQICLLRYFQSKFCNSYSVLVAPQSCNTFIVNILQTVQLERRLRFQPGIPKGVHHYEAFRLE